MRAWRAAMVAVLAGAVFVGPAPLGSSAGICASPGSGAVIARPVTGLVTETTGVSLGVEDTQVRWTRWHTRVVYGDSARLEGQVVTDDGALPDAPVDLFAREAGSQQWTLVQSAMSNPENGVFSFTCLEPTMTTDYRAVYDGTIYYAGSHGDRVVRVARRVTDNMTQTAPNRFRFDGSVQPRYRSRPILLQRKACSTCTWRTVARKDTTGRSSWRFAIDTSTFTGRRWFRVVVPPDDRYVRSDTSRAWRITRR